MDAQNLYITGMPGSGKTTIGRMLAGHLGRPFCDLDARIEAAAGCPIQDLFAREGEPAFRALETAALRDMAAMRGWVVATGGGILTRAENHALLRTGVILFNDRPLERILGDVNPAKRPLLAKGKEQLYALYDARIAAYQTVCDLHLVNTGSVRGAVAQAAELYQDFLARRV